jgi:sirohydrochlorin cobaltochelatase
MTEALSPDSMQSRHAVVLVGHGAPPADAPPDLVPRLKRLEGERRRRGGPMTEEELAVDTQLRQWPRTQGNDPYKTGIERLLGALQAALPDAEVVVAYNEFCAPSLDDAVLALAARGFHRISVVPTMLTRGGVHSEVEIPEVLAHLQAKLPTGARLTYAWPFAEADVAALLAARVSALEPR